MAMIARGIRNHNPGNIRASSIDWDGEVKPGNEMEFTVFKAPWWGIRAMAKLVLRYHSFHNLKTVASIIGRYAPHHENPTGKYIQYVSRKLGVSHETSLEMNYYTLETMIRAMIKFECGSCPYTWEIATGLIMAGIEPRATVVDPGRLSYQFKEVQ